MKLVVIILNKVECLEELLNEFTAHNLEGATILDSKGLMQEVSNEDELHITLVMRHILNLDRKANKTILLAASEERVPIIKGIVEKVTGGLEQGDTGILFTVPIEDLMGFKVKKS